MKSVLLRKLLSMVFFLPFISTVYALEIVSPKDNEQITAGTDLKIILKPVEGEEIEEIIVQLFPLPCSSLSKKFTEKITIPDDFLGSYELLVLVADKSRNLKVLQRKVFVKLQPDVILNSLIVEPESIELFKLGPKCPPRDREMYETEYISVTGTYSDGIKRKLADYSVGTHYKSSNEKIVTIDNIGKVTAQNTGKAVITIKHGNFSDRVQVTVNRCSKLNN